MSAGRVEWEDTSCPWPGRGIVFCCGGISCLASVNDQVYERRDSPTAGCGPEEAAAAAVTPDPCHFDRSLTKCWTNATVWLALQSPEEGTTTASAQRQFGQILRRIIFVNDKLPRDFRQSTASCREHVVAGRKMDALKVRSRKNRKEKRITAKFLNLCDRIYINVLCTETSDI